MARKRKSTLGPFPKTLRWQELVARYLAPENPVEIADALLTGLKTDYLELALDGAANRAMVFLVALPVCSRFDDPCGALRDYYGIELEGEPTLSSLNESLDRFLLDDSPVKVACSETIATWLHRSENTVRRLFNASGWMHWRTADRSAFCDLGREFFTQLNRIYFSRALRVGPGRPEVDVFAEEMSLITRTFTARWFNACARTQVPDLGSIRWYLGHSLGKLDLELSRELSDWVEEPRVWKSRQPRLLDLAS